MSVEIESKPLCYNFKKNNLLVLYCKFNVRELLVIFIKYLVAFNFSCCCCLRVISDMDEPQGRLMGAHGYCTQVRFSMQYLYTTIFFIYGYQSDDDDEDDDDDDFPDVNLKWNG